MLDEVPSKIVRVGVVLCGTVIGDIQGLFLVTVNVTNNSPSEDNSDDESDLQLR